MKILLIESDDIVRDPLAKGMRRRGHLVEEETDFDAALGLLAHKLGDYDVVICSETVEQASTPETGNGLNLANGLCLARTAPRIIVLADTIEGRTSVPSVARDLLRPKNTRDQVLGLL